MRVEYFVLTGQAKTYASEEFNNAFPYVFEKGKNEDEDELFDRLVKAANIQTETQIRHEHQSVFDILKGYDPGITKTILNILKGIKKGANDFNDELYFTQLRIILESLPLLILCSILSSILLLRMSVRISMSSTRTENLEEGE